ncbi:hypothetical protein V8C26DRAFT_426500 [Trichoderma gracile]
MATSIGHCYHHNAVPPSINGSHSREAFSISGSHRDKATSVNYCHINKSSGISGSHSNQALSTDPSDSFRGGLTLAAGAQLAMQTLPSSEESRREPGLPAAEGVATAVALHATDDVDAGLATDGDKRKSLYLSVVKKLSTIVHLRRE